MWFRLDAGATADEVIENLRQCPKLGVERTQRGHAATSESDPQRSCVAWNFCTAHLLLSAISRVIISCFDGLRYREGGME